MAFNLSAFSQDGLEESFLRWLLHDYGMERIIHFEKLWGYYRNEICELAGNWGANINSESARPYRQAQEYGLPSRITGTLYHYYGGMLHGESAQGIRRKEVVIENDIAWRVDAMVDFLFGKAIALQSAAPDADRAFQIKQILEAVFSASGGAVFFQELGLLGSIYGFADVILRMHFSDTAMMGSLDSSEQVSSDLTSTSFLQLLTKIRSSFSLEILEAGRSLPLLDETDYRRIRLFVQHYWQVHNELENAGGEVHRINYRQQQTRDQKQTHRVEIMGKDWWQVYDDEHLIAEGVNSLGVVPVVHIQNMAKPRYYEGQSDVEPLMPLQDELNTRLSDRANRITFQSFKMYLGKGIEGFEDRLVAPGRMWSTENPEATIEEFGGDPGSPSEEQHISHIREALDKASGVASVAAGILKGRIGNLTSAVALKVTLMGLLAKTERKRLCYGEGIKELCRLILLALDKTGLFPNGPEEREIEIHWPSPLPENVTEKLQEALLKKQLGIKHETVLEEMGYKV